VQLAVPTVRVYPETRMLHGSGDGDAATSVPEFKSSKVKQEVEVAGLKMNAWAKFIVMEEDPS
jgi:hypothetical protein